MSIWKQNRPKKQKQSYLSDILEDAFNKGKELVDASFNGEETTTNNTNAPTINIIETGEHIRVEVAAAGWAKENFKLNIEEGALVISGQKEKTDLPKGEKYLLQEFGYGTFKRAFKIPETIDTTKIKATYKEGILYIILGKKEEFIKKSFFDIDIL